MPTNYTKDDAHRMLESFLQNNLSDTGTNKSDDDMTDEARKAVDDCPLDRDALRLIARNIDSTIITEANVAGSLGEAIATAIHHGGTLDFDCMTAIHDIMGAHLGWEFYGYANARYDDDLYELLQYPDEARAWLTTCLKDMLSHKEAPVIETEHGDVTITGDPDRDDKTTGPSDNEPVTGLRINLDTLAAIYAKEDIERHAKDNDPYPFRHVHEIVTRLMRVFYDDRHSWYLPLAMSALTKAGQEKWTLDDIDKLLNDLEAEHVTPLGTDPDDTADRINATLDEDGSPANLRILPTGNEECPLIIIRS